MLNAKDIKIRKVFLMSFTYYLFMKHVVLVLILGMFFMTSCVQVCNEQVVVDQIPKDYVEYTVNLKNNLGELTISLPQEFDTVYSWTKIGDNHCADFEMFRFANKRYSLLQEDVEWYRVIPDSLYQLTIVQSKYLDCADTPNFDDKKLETVIEDLKAQNPAKRQDCFIREIRTINDKKFMITGFNYQEKETCISEIFLITEVNGHPVWLKFICQAANCTNFIDRVEKSFNTIKIVHL